MFNILPEIITNPYLTDIYRKPCSNLFLKLPDNNQNIFIIFFLAFMAYLSTKHHPPPLIFSLITAVDTDLGKWSLCFVCLNFHYTRGNGPQI